MSAVARDPVPPILAWQLVKRPGSNTYDALVGEQLWMYGVYSSLADGREGPSYFRPFEWYERLVRRFLSRIHLVRPPRDYAPTFAFRSEDDPAVYVGRPSSDAPSPARPRGVITLKFEDDLGNRSAGLLSVYFRGTATATIHPKANLSLAPGPIPTISAGVEIGSFTRSATIAPVRDDPRVSVRLLTGSDLANYLAEYLPPIIERTSLRIGGLREPEPEPEPEGILSEFLGYVSEAVPEALGVEPPIDELELEDAMDIRITGEIRPGRSALLAVQTTTPAGSVMSDVVELFADEQGQIFEY